jgi:hypothetical protein
MISDVLLKREDLIDAYTIALVANGVLAEFVREDGFSSSTYFVMNEIFRRDMDDLEEAVIYSHPELVFQSVVEVYCESRLYHSWHGCLLHHVGTTLSSDWLEVLKSTKELAAALLILRYPRNLVKGCTEISKRLSMLRDDAQGDERPTMQAALLRTAIDRGPCKNVI